MSDGTEVKPNQGRKWLTVGEWLALPPEERDQALAETLADRTEEELQAVGEEWVNLLTNPPPLTEEEQREEEERKRISESALQATAAVWEKSLQEWAGEVPPIPELRALLLAALKAGFEVALALKRERSGGGPPKEEEVEALVGAFMKAWGPAFEKWAARIEKDRERPSYPSRIASDFLNALQRGPGQLSLWAQEEEGLAQAHKKKDELAEAGRALVRAQTLRAAVDQHQTRPGFSLREWEALWGLHALLRRENYPQRLVFTRAEFHEASGAKVSFRRGRKDIARSDRKQLDEAVQALFEREQVLYGEWTDQKGKLLRGQFHLHILTDWGKVEEVDGYVGEDRYYATFHEVALQQIRDHFVNLPPLREVKAALEGAGGTGRGGGMVTDLELILWLHNFPGNPDEGGCNVDWLNLAEKVGLGNLLAHREKKKARARLILAYDRAVKLGYLLSYELDQPGGLGVVDRLVKNTAKLLGRPQLDLPPPEGV